MQKVITYADSRGNKVTITAAQKRVLEAAGRWLRNPETGEEYCQVSHGLHSGHPDYSDEDIVAVAAGASLPDREW